MQEIRRASALLRIPSYQAAFIVAVDAQGVTNGEAGLFLSPHEMARFGYLYLRSGLWEGKQIIPSSWVDRAQERKMPGTFGFHYANLGGRFPQREHTWLGAAIRS